MALDKVALALAIQEVFDSESDIDVNPLQARQRQAVKIADAIDVFVRGGEVTVEVTGTSATGGAITGTGIGDLT